MAGEIATEQLADGVFSADTGGREKLATNFFDETTLSDKIANDAITATVWATKAAAGAIGASVDGRASMASGYFDAATVDDKIATGAIGEDRLTANEVHGRALANGAAVAVGAVPATAHAIPTVLTLTIAAGVSADLDFTGLPFAIRVIDAWLVKTTAAGGGAGNVQLQTSGGVAISGTMSIDVADEAITRAGSISDATHNLAAAATLRVRRTRTASTDESCILYVKCLRFV